jgi:hypothetical protein
MGQALAGLGGAALVMALGMGVGVLILQRFDLAPAGNPAHIPEWVRLVTFGLLYAGIFWKARLRESPQLRTVLLVLIGMEFWARISQAMT